MAKEINQIWLVVHPASLLQVLEEVEAGAPAAEVMMKVLDVAKASMEEDDE